MPVVVCMSFILASVAFSPVLMCKVVVECSLFPLSVCRILWVYV